MRHRFAVTNWLTAAYRTVQLVGRQAVHLGGTLPRKVSTGEVVAIGTNDISNLGQVMDVSARFSGAIVSFLLVAVILLSTSVTLGLLVLIGVPVPDAADRPAAAPARPDAARTSGTSWASSPTPPATSSVGCGCCAASAARRSSTTATGASRRPPDRPASRWLGCSRCWTRSRCSCPGVFVVLVVWVGARYAVQGQISPGELVAFYGYSAFLMIPLRTATEYANKLIRARVSARRVMPGAGARRPTTSTRRTRPSRRPRARSWPTPAPGSGSAPG